MRFFVGFEYIFDGGIDLGDASHFLASWLEFAIGKAAARSCTRSLRGPLAGPFCCESVQASSRHDQPGESERAVAASRATSSPVCLQDAPGSGALDKTPIQVAHDETTPCSCNDRQRTNHLLCNLGVGCPSGHSQQVLRSPMRRTRWSPQAGMALNSSRSDGRKCTRQHI